MVECIECGDRFALRDGAEPGAFVDCPACGAELEVLAVDPAEVARAPAVEEDWGE